MTNLKIGNGKNIKHLMQAGISLMPRYMKSYIESLREHSKACFDIQQATGATKEEIKEIEKFCTSSVYSIMDVRNMVMSGKLVLENLNRCIEKRKIDEVR